MAKSIPWSGWALIQDQQPVQVRGADGYLCGRVRLYDAWGKFVGYESRKNLTPLDLEHFPTDAEKRQAAQLLSEMRLMFLESLEVQCG